MNSSSITVIKKEGYANTNKFHELTYAMIDQASVTFSLQHVL